ncbi:MAG TPA: hypothetical protein VFI61_03700 [Patescibacteria group bacterium]|nr:hypothetical protein [Patescibacteria group bacterium]
MSRVDDEPQTTKVFSIDFWSAQKIAEELHRNILIAENEAIGEYNLITGARIKPIREVSVEEVDRKVV